MKDKRVHEFIGSQSHDLNKPDDENQSVLGFYQS